MVSIQAITNREDILVVARKCTTNESQSIYDMVYSINEGYYHTLLESIKNNPHPTKNNFSSIDIGLLYLLKLSDKFIKFLSHNIKHVDLKLAACIRAMKEDTTKTYQHREYLIENVRYRFPRMDEDLISKLDIIPDTEENLIRLLSKKNAVRDTMKVITNSIDDWFLDNTTQEVMSKYLESKALISIDEGVYNVKQLVSMISIFHKESVKYYDLLKDDIKQTQKKMKILRSKTSKLNKQYISSKSISDEDKSKVVDLFREYETLLLHIAEQISVYHRSIIWLYGKNVSYVMDTVQDMYEDIPQKYIKDNIFKHDYSGRDLTDEVDRMLS